MSPVRSTCVPPQNSREEPMSSTRTSSPYFSPNSIIAPDFFASSIGMTCARVGVFCRISAFTSARPGGSPASLIGLSCAKSKRVLSASTSEPFCCTCGPSTSRSALCIRCVAEWLRMVRLRRATSTRASTLSPTFSAPVFSVPWWPNTSAWIFCVSATDEGAAGARPARPVAHLAARLGVERRLVEHHDAGFARLQLLRPARPRGRARPPSPCRLSVS